MSSRGLSSLKNNYNNAENLLSLDIVIYMKKCVSISKNIKTVGKNIHSNFYTYLHLNVSHYLILNKTDPDSTPNLIKSSLAQGLPL